MDTYTLNWLGENILTAWQTPVSVRALMGWLQVRARLSRSSHGFFLLSPPFQTYFL